MWHISLRDIDTEKKLELGKTIAMLQFFLFL